MSDIFDKEKRSIIMRSIKSQKNKSTELKIIELFKENNIHGWKRGYSVKGRPDFVFLDKKIVIFVDGCFWHGYNCRNVTPSDNAEFWMKKIENNRRRDMEVNYNFQSRKWKVVRIWECELKNKNKQATLERIMSFIS